MAIAVKEGAQVACTDGGVFTHDEREAGFLHSRARGGAKRMFGFSATAASDEVGDVRALGVTLAGRCACVLLRGKSYLVHIDLIDKMICRKSSAKKPASDCVQAPNGLLGPRESAPSGK